MKTTETGLPGVVVLTPRRFDDARGFFCESWSRRTLAGLGIELDFVQDSQSVSAKQGTVRGLHYQGPPEAQDKLVRCGQGAILDVAVDIRKGSPTWGNWVGVELSAKNGRQLLVPAGFLHGFVTRAPHTEVLYKCTASYNLECEGSVHFADSSIGIDWGIDPAEAVLSVKDAKAGPLCALETPFVYRG